MLRHVMRRLIKSAISAIVTFAVGVLVSIAWSHVFPQRVSLCMLAQNPAAYDRKLITIEAFGSVTGNQGGKAGSAEQGLEQTRG